MANPFPRSIAHAGRGRERGAGDECPQLDELVCRDGDGAEGRPRSLELDVPAHPHGMAPRAQDLPRCRLDGDEPVERLRPLVTPDLQVHVDDVVVRDREPRSVYEMVKARVWSCALKYQTIRTLSPRRSTPNVPGVLPRARVVAARVGGAPFDDERVHERLACAERDVAVAEVEVARERDLETLAHAHRPVLLQLHADIGGEQREAVGARRARQREDHGRGDSRER